MAGQLFARTEGKQMQIPADRKPQSKQDFVALRMRSLVSSLKESDRGKARAALREIRSELRTKDLEEFKERSRALAETGEPEALSILLETKGPKGLCPNFKIFQLAKLVASSKINNSMRHALLERLDRMVSDRPEEFKGKVRDFIKERAQQSGIHMENRPKSQEGLRYTVHHTFTERSAATRTDSGSMPMVCEPLKTGQEDLSLHHVNVMEIAFKNAGFGAEQPLYLDDVLQQKEWKGLEQQPEEGRSKVQKEKSPDSFVLLPFSFNQAKSVGTQSMKLGSPPAKVRLPPAKIRVERRHSTAMGQAQERKEMPVANKIVQPKKERKPGHKHKKTLDIAKRPGRRMQKRLPKAELSSRSEPRKSRNAILRNNGVKKAGRTKKTKKASTSRARKPALSQKPFAAKKKPIKIKAKDTRKIGQVPEKHRAVQKEAAKKKGRRRRIKKGNIKGRGKASQRRRRHLMMLLSTGPVRRRLKN